MQYLSTFNWKTLINDFEEYGNLSHRLLVIKQYYRYVVGSKNMTASLLFFTQRYFKFYKNSLYLLFENAYLSLFCECITVLDINNSSPFILIKPMSRFRQ